MRAAWLLLALPLAAVPFSPPEPVTVKEVAGMLDRAKASHTASKDSSGDTMFDVEHADYSARVLLYMVDDSENVAKVTWTTSFDLKDGIKPEAVNDWNAENIDIKVFRDPEGDPVLEATHTTQGGVDAANLDAWLSDVLAEADAFVAAHGGTDLRTKPATPRG